MKNLNIYNLLSVSFILSILILNSLDVYGQSSRLDKFNEEFEEMDIEKINTDAELEIEKPTVHVEIKGTSEDDKLKGGSGDDELSGEDGNDILIGLSGDDKLKGGSGDDTLEGQEGDDKLKGGSGDDILNGGDGKDILEGGEGSDLFICDADDKVKDFNSLENDKKEGTCVVDDLGILTPLN